MGLSVMKLDDLVEVLRSSRVTWTAVATAAAVTFTLSGLSPLYAGQKTESYKSMDNVNVLLANGSDILSVPIMAKTDKKKNKKIKDAVDKADSILSDIPSVPLVPLVQPINKSTPPTMGPLTARMVKSIQFHVEQEYDNEDTIYVGRLDLNRDGKRDHKLVVDVSTGNLTIKLEDVSSGKSLVPDMISVLGEKAVAIYGNFLDGKNLAFLIDTYKFKRIGLVDAYSTVKVPHSVREKSLHDKDAIDGLIFCDVDTGCFNAPYHTIDQIIKNRPQEIADYFEQLLKRTHQAIAHPKFKYTVREAEDYIRNNAAELRSQIIEEYKLLGVDNVQYKLDNKLVNQFSAEIISLMSKNHPLWARGESLSTTLAESAGKSKPKDMNAKDIAENTLDKPDYVGIKPTEKSVETPKDQKPKTFVKKSKDKTLDNMVVTTKLPENVQIDDKPYLPDATKQPIVGAADVVGQNNWYDKWWVWTIAGAVVAGAAATTAVVLTMDSGSSTSTGPDNFVMTYGDYTNVGGK